MLRDSPLVCIYGSYSNFCFSSSAFTLKFMLAALDLKSAGRRILTSLKNHIPYDDDDARYLFYYTYVSYLVLHIIF